MNDFIFKMNKFILIYLFAFSVSAATAQNSKDNELCQLFLSALKSGDDNNILKCTPDKTEFLKLWKSVDNNLEISASEMDSLLDEFNRRAIENMKRTRQAGEKVGVKWSNIHVDSIVSKETIHPESPLPRHKTFLWLSADKKSYCIELTECTYIADRWRLTDRFVFKK